MRIAILGTRGIPNNHGGFEQFAEFFSVYASQSGHEVYVYNSHNHPYREIFFNGVNILHCFDPEYLVGTFGQFIYDLNCILDSRKRKFDVILQLGYTSSSVWHWLLPSKPLIITNMDGMEWKRTKYRSFVKRFLRYAEKLGVNNSDYLISDSIGIQEYIKNQYNKDSKFIPYGAINFNDPDNLVPEKYNITKYEYLMLIARLEPENNIEEIIKGVVNSNTKYPLLIIGGINKYGTQLKARYGQHQNIKFLGAVYDLEQLNNLRYYSRYYFHGHSVGGTNPSLLEAMASEALIIAHDNIFNKSILEKNAAYFSTGKEINEILREDSLFTNKDIFSKNNKSKISEYYNWNKINHEYLQFMTHPDEAK